jgi:hypothetical protein
MSAPSQCTGYSLCSGFALKAPRVSVCAIARAKLSTHVSVLPSHPEAPAKTTSAEITVSGTLGLPTPPLQSEILPKEAESAYGKLRMLAFLRA